MTTSTATRLSSLSFSFSSVDTRMPPMERYRSIPLRDWSKSEVSAWLDSIELKEYSRAFAKHGVRGDRLAGLTRDELHAMNVTKVGHVKKILSWIRDANALHRGFAPPPPATTTTTSTSSSSSTVPTSPVKLLSTIARRNSFGGAQDEPTPSLAPSFLQSMSRLALPLRHSSSPPGSPSSSSPSSSPSSEPSLSPRRGHRASQHFSSLSLPKLQSLSGQTNAVSQLRRTPTDTTGATLAHRRKSRSASVSDERSPQQFYDPSTSSDDDSCSSLTFFTPEVSGESLNISMEELATQLRSSGNGGTRCRGRSVSDGKATYARLYPSVYLWVKLVFEDDVTILRFKRKSFTIKRLQREITRIHELKSLRLKWVDSEGDCIEIKTTEFLAYALQDWQRHFDQGSQRMIRIEAFKRDCN